MRVQSLSGIRLQRWGRFRGFAMLEVLVGLLILSAGILGLVGTLAAATRAQGVAQYRASAVALSGELIGLMWADAPANRPGYATAATRCTYQPCAHWVAKVQATLPHGECAVAIDPVTHITAITISWSTPTDGSHRYVTSTSIL